jgi:hypothetical protein
MADRMGVKRRDQGGDAACTGQRHGFANNSLMPGMNAVKIAERNHAAAKGVWYQGIAIKSFHRGGL